MSDLLFAFFIYIGQLCILTLGILIACGFTAWLAEISFLKLIGNGSGTAVYVSSIIGTPVHELGHACMCLLFGHKITKMKLLLPPNNSTGTLGFVEHSYSRKNLWAKLGNLFIGMGPIFSGLAVITLMLWLCFPDQWAAYINNTATLTQITGVEEISRGILSLLLSIPSAFDQNWWRALIGIIVILSVSQHVTLSAADVKGSLSAFPLYLLIVLIFAIVTTILQVQTPIVNTLYLFNLRLLSLFAIVIAFSLAWVAIALFIRLVKSIARCF